MKPQLDSRLPPSVLNVVQSIRRGSRAFRPEAALVLGSGLGGLAQALTAVEVLETSQLPDYPSHSVEGHQGRIILGHLEKSGRRSKPLVAFQGRIHFYESSSIESVVFPIQVAKGLGAGTLILTNAAGAVNRSFRPGDLMLIQDVLSLTFLFEKERSERSAESRTLRSAIDGDRMFNSGQPFDESLSALFEAVASDLKIPLRRGTYCWLKGPSYETAAEIEMLSRFGVDAVGMSTVPEVSVASSLEMRVAGISLISNMGTGIQAKKLAHSEVTGVAEKASVTFRALLEEILLRL